MGQLGAHWVIALITAFALLSPTAFAFDAARDADLSSTNRTMAASSIAGFSGVLITDHRPAKEEMMPSDGVARRSLSTYAINENTTAVVGAFSMISFLGSSDQMQSIRHGSGDHNKRVLDQLLKTAAAVYLTSGHKGRYSGS